MPLGTQIVIANPFNEQTFQSFIPNNCVYVQLLGVSHPSPAKKQQFYEIDLQSATVSAKAAHEAKVSHFVYVSVAQEPAKVMEDYQKVRKIAEEKILAYHLKTTFIRPWYVVGPGHQWPILLKPLYWFSELVPPIRQKARALGLVTLPQMLNALVIAIEAQPIDSRIIEVADIKSKRLAETVSLSALPSI